MMKKYNCFSVLCLAAAMAFTACTQDELTDDTLPEGKYPLEIASAAIEAESSVQPWGAQSPQTRVYEDPMSDTNSAWETGDEFYVKFQDSDEVGTYKITASYNGTTAAVTPVYWQSANTEQTIIAWYAPDADADGKLDLSDQSKGIIYAMRAETKATYNNTSGAVSLKFGHQLAKVRVIFSGATSKVNEVTINGYTSCTVTEGTVTADTQPGNIIMWQSPRQNNIFEATVVPDCEITTVKVNGIPATLNQTITPEIGKYYKITITVQEASGTGAE